MVSWKDRMMHNFYEVKTKCPNCKRIALTQITKGRSMSLIKEIGKCSNCGSVGLEVVE